MTSLRKLILIRRHDFSNQGGNDDPYDVIYKIVSPLKDLNKRMAFFLVLQQSATTIETTQAVLYNAGCKNIELVGRCGLNWARDESN